MDLDIPGKHTRYYKLFREVLFNYYLPPVLGRGYINTTDGFLSIIKWLITERLNEISSLSCPVLEDLEAIFPFAFVFLLPRKKAITMYAVYAGALAEKENTKPPADFNMVASYYHISEEDLIAYVKYRLFLYKMLVPIRVLLNLPIANEDDSIRELRRKMPSLPAYQIDFLQKFSTPSKLLYELYRISKERTINDAIDYCYKIVHGFDAITKYIRQRERNLVVKRIDYLIRNYPE
ncbi:MAG: hypothetical protein ACP6IQ_07440 [Candidatus Njordarchaeia archaeon]